MTSQHLIPVFTGINDVPTTPTTTAAGNASHVIAKHNALAGDVATLATTVASIPNFPSQQFLGDNNIVLPYSGFGAGNQTDGLFYYLGSKAKRYTWENPAINQVKIRASSLLNNNPADLVKLTGRVQHSSIATQDVANSFIWFTFGESLKFIPSYICIRQANTANEQNWLVNFKLEGTTNFNAMQLPNGDVVTDYNSNPFNIAGANHTLLTVANEPPTDPWILKTATNPGSGSPTGYNSFRILQTGINNSGNNILQFSEIEMYGTIKVVHFDVA